MYCNGRILGYKRCRDSSASTSGLSCVTAAAVSPRLSSIHSAHAQPDTRADIRACKRKACAQRCGAQRERMGEGGEWGGRLGTRARTGVSSIPCRSKVNQYETCSLIKIENVNQKSDVEFYQGKR